MKKTSIRNVILTGLATGLAAFALACGGDDDDNNGGNHSRPTSCKSYICESGNIVRQGAIGQEDGEASQSGCVYEEIGRCAAGCAMDRELVRLPGCNVGNACILEARELPPPGDITSATECHGSAETLSNVEECGGYPCLSNKASGMDMPPYHCAVTRCFSDGDCAADEFCRCRQEKQADGSYTAENWCVKKEAK